MRRERRSVIWAIAMLFAAISLTVGAQPARAQVAIDPFYAGNYAIVFQGPIPSVPSDHGGITFKFGDPNTLLVCGSANSSHGAIYSIGVTRDPNTNHINGFVQPAVLVATAVNCDGGLAFDPFDPNNVLFYSRWPSSELGQIGPTSSITDKVIALAPLGVEDAHSALTFVPPGFPGAGNLKMVTWDGGQWNDATIALDATGVTYDLATLTEIPGSRVTGGPEGILYVPTTSPLFGNPSVLVLAWSAGTVDAYQVDANGDPIVSTRQVFMTAPSPDQPEGAAQDSITGDILFGTFPGPDVIIVSGFATAAPAGAAGPAPRRVPAR